MKKILCLQAHPNDALAGCGGTLLRHKEGGDEIERLRGRRRLHGAAARLCVMTG